MSGRQTTSGSSDQGMARNNLRCCRLLGAALRRGKSQIEPGCRLAPESIRYQLRGVEESTRSFQLTRMSHTKGGVRLSIIVRRSVARKLNGACAELLRPIPVGNLSKSPMYVREGLRTDQYDLTASKLDALTDSVHNAYRPYVQHVTTFCICPQ